MILFNPTDSKLSVQIFGVAYEIEPKSKSRDLPDEAALYWRTNLHSFLIVSEPEKVKEVKIEEKEEAPKKTVTKK